ncbi:MAG: HPr family phosphocarrier protein [Janthinobacterium lividum]
MSDPAADPVLDRVVVVCNRRGLHARAAARFVAMAERFAASVEVAGAGSPEQSVSARSIMGLMMLGVGQGSGLSLRAQGWDAKEALDALAALVESGFDEQE